MGSSTIFTSILVSNTIIPLLAAIFSLIGAIGGGYVVWFLNSKNERYQKLYGPLRFNLQMMRLIVENKEEVLVDIKEWKDVNTQIDLMQKHLSPLTKKWIEHKDNIRKLFESNPGLIKQKDFKDMSDFMDGCLKREVTEDGQNVLAINTMRTDKLLDAIKNLQNSLL